MRANLGAAYYDPKTGYMIGVGDPLVPTYLTGDAILDLPPMTNQALKVAGTEDVSGKIPGFTLRAAYVDPNTGEVVGVGDPVAPGGMCVVGTTNSIPPSPLYGPCPEPAPVRPGGDRLPVTATTLPETSGQGVSQNSQMPWLALIAVGIGVLLLRR